MTLLTTEGVRLRCRMRSQDHFSIFCNCDAQVCGPVRTQFNFLLFFQINAMMADHPPKKRRQTTLSTFFSQTSASPQPATTDAPPAEPQPDSGSSSAQEQQLYVQEEAVSESAATLPVPSNDIGLAVGRQLHDEDRVRFLQPWRPSSATDFPSSVRQSDKASKSGMERRRRLLPRHLDDFPWLAVSRCPEMDGVFCFPCVLFAAGSRTAQAQPLGKLRNFDDLTGKDGVLTRHQSTNYHQQSVVAMDNFKSVIVDRTQLDIRSNLDEQHKREVEQNRKFLKPIVDTILTCARQNIALRAHRGEVGAVDANGVEPAENDGNFRSLLRYRIRAGDKVLEEHVRTAKRNAIYHSPDIQNSLLSAAGDLVKEQILSRVKKATCWAIIADETTDRHHREQLAVVIRYVRNESGTWRCFEDPVAIIDIHASISATADDDSEVRLSGAAIADALLRVVCELGLDLAACVGQGYDGASALSSQRVGAAQRFQERAVNAHYFHCSMHCLNLSAMKAISIPSLRHAQDVVSDAVSCFRSSAKRSALLKCCIEKCDDTRISKSQLIKLCATRFVERHTSIVCFRNLIRFVMESLTKMTTWQSSEARKSAQTLINSISQSETIIGLVVLENISSIMLPTTRLLQTSGLDLVAAMTAVNNMIESLSALRSSERFAKVVEDAEAVAQGLEVTLTKPRTASRSVYRPAASTGSDDSVQDYYRINVFFPAVDQVQQDLQLRFGPKQQLAVKFSRAVPASMRFDDADGDWAELEGAVDVYTHMFSDPVIVIKSEYDQWRRKWQQQPAEQLPNTALAALDHCQMYPNLSAVLLQLLATLPVTTAEAERVFSKMERTVTAIRASMEEERLESLILLQVHREDTPSIEAVIDRFATTSARRLKFVL